MHAQGAFVESSFAIKKQGYSSTAKWPAGTNRATADDKQSCRRARLARSSQP